MLVLWLGAWFILAKFIPPPSPQMSPEQVAAFYADHINGIRAGNMLVTFAAALLVPFAAVITVQMKRIEGLRPVLSYVQLVSAGLLSLEFIVPVMVFQTLVFRLDAESARLIQMLSDMGWLMIVAVVSSAMVQIASIGVVILADTRTRPVFPRWAGWFNLWVALSIAPAGIVVFFKSGIFAWNGVAGFYLPLAAFAAWFVVMAKVLLSAVEHDVVDAPTARES
jgi:hypothetical protein